jgi:hypothetical protein
VKWQVDEMALYDQSLGKVRVTNSGLPALHGLGLVVLDVLFQIFAAPQIQAAAPATLVFVRMVIL